MRVPFYFEAKCSHRICIEFYAVCYPIYFQDVEGCRLNCNGIVCLSATMLAGPGSCEGGQGWRTARRLRRVRRDLRSWGPHGKAGIRGDCRRASTGFRTAWETPHRGCRQGRRSQEPRRYVPVRQDPATGAVGCLQAPRRLREWPQLLTERGIPPSTRQKNLGHGRKNRPWPRMCRRQPPGGGRLFAWIRRRTGRRHGPASCRPCRYPR